MLLRSPLSYFAGVVILCGAALAQNSRRHAGPNHSTAGSFPAGTSGNPGMNSSTYPSGGPMDSTQMEPRISDKAFVKKAAENDVTEVELGKLAQEKGSSEAVKEFGKRIVERSHQGQSESARGRS